MRWSPCCLLLILCGAIPATAAPTLSVDARSVVVSGLTSGAASAWIGLTLERPEWRLELTHWARVVSDDDRDGTVAFELDRTVPPVSLWAVVDTVTGDLQVAPGADMDLREVAFPIDRATWSVDGAMSFSDSRSYLLLLAVRPGVGAWVLHIADGTANDADGAPDGIVTPALGNMDPMSKGLPEFDGLRPGDTVVGMDPTSFQYYAARIATPGPQDQ